MTLHDLQNNILFRGMTDLELSECLSALSAQEKTYEKDEIILHSGDRTDRMGLVLLGSVTIESIDPWGSRTILSHVGKGQFFAETYAMLPDEVLLVDVRANETCRILFLRVGDLSEQPSSGWKTKVLNNILTISLHKNLALSGRSFHTAPKSARGRILAYLSSVSLKMHSREFDIPFDRQQLADYLNLERTNMSKELSKMKKDGLIDFRKSHFRLIG
ncbi:MAG: Crp/Fnr family transcriptional regulator [Clostridium sp.]|nr:Crp/Fnr family transcriptional regulator [Clostridium sp.]